MLRLLWMATTLFVAMTLNVHGHNKSDSISKSAPFSQIDSLEFQRLIALSGRYIYTEQNIEKSKQVLLEALSLAARDSTYWALAVVHNSYGTMYRNTARYTIALEHHNLALDFANRSGDTRLIAKTHNNIGVVYRRIDNQPQAVHHHLMGLRSAEAVKDSFSISVSKNSLGNIYSLSGQYQEALGYFWAALSLSKSMNNSLGQAMNLNNIGEVYEFMEQYDSAMVYYTESLRFNELIDSPKGKAISYNAIGKIHLYQGKPYEALPLFNRALKIDLELGDKKFIADSYLNLSRGYNAINSLEKANHFGMLAIELAKEIGSILHLQWAFETLSEIRDKQNHPNQALNFYKTSIAYKDSIINEKNARAIALLELTYDIDKKEQEILILKHEQTLNQKELARQVVIRNFYFAALLFALVLAIITFYAFHIKKKSNRLLRMQKEEIEESNSKLNLQQKEILVQNEEIRRHQYSIEQKNFYLEEAYKVIEGYIGKITDSIRYAERIQNAILPPLSLGSKHFTDSFTFYKPKDFVSGDFYWLSIEKDTLYLAVADCTGHGVPGAFMSIIGMDLLNQSITQKGIKEPGEILDFLNVELRTKLRKDEKELVLKDSMDIAILKYTIGNNFLDYSGALIPITLVRNGKLIDIKPNHVSIGISTQIHDKPFKQERIELYPNDWIYLYTDGFMDQFGGDDNKKFMRSRFLSTLQEMSSKEGTVQKSELEHIFRSWQGNHEQIDDVLIFAFKV